MDDGRYVKLCCFACSVEVLFEPELDRACGNLADGTDRFGFAAVVDLFNKGVMAQLSRVFDNVPNQQSRPINGRLLLRL